MRGLSSDRNNRPQQECAGFWVPDYMAFQHELNEDIPGAEIKLPTDWLMPWLDLETVRQPQRPDTITVMTGSFLKLSGVELVVERRWLREAYWRQVKHAITRGYIYRSSAVSVTLRGERRERERRQTGSQAA